MFKKSASTSEPAYRDPEENNPQTASEYYDRGWLLYSRGDYQRAIDDLREALRMDPDNVDASYALGLSLKASGQGPAAVELFKKAATTAEYLENAVRGRMIRRLAIGHIHEIETGDWNLEKETWHKKA